MVSPVPTRWRLCRAVISLQARNGGFFPVSGEDAVEVHKAGAREAQGMKATKTWPRATGEGDRQLAWPGEWSCLTQRWLREVQNAWNRSESDSGKHRQGGHEGLTPCPGVEDAACRCEGQSGVTSGFPFHIRDCRPGEKVQVDICCSSAGLMKSQRANPPCLFL